MFFCEVFLEGYVVADQGFNPRPRFSIECFFLLYIEEQNYIYDV